jgi:hypothetical protein
MKKIFIIIIAIIAFSSCKHPILESKEYKIVDTLDVTYSTVFSLDPINAKVIIKYDSTFHYGVVNKYGNLIEMNPRNLKVKEYK